MQIMHRTITYHWVILAGCFLIMMASLGIVINCFNLYAVELISTQGYSASNIQTIGMISTISSLLGGLMVGKIMNKFTMRVVMPISAVIMSAGYSLYSICSTLNMFYLFAVVVGFGLSGVSMIPCGMIINNWFKEKKGFATGIVFSGSVAGGLLMVQLTKWIIAFSGWRTAYMVMGIVSAVVLLPVTLFLVKENPSEMGMLPYGAETESNSSIAAEGENPTRAIDHGASFWLLAASFFLIGFVALGVQSNIGIYLTKNMGYSAKFSADIISLIMVFGVFGKLLLGSIYDKRGVKFGTLYSAALYALMVVALIRSENKIVVFAFAILFGLVSAMMTVTPSYLTTQICDKNSYTRVYGQLNLFFGIGGAIGPVVASSVFDRTGMYQPIWIVFAGLSLVLCATILFAVQKNRRIQNSSSAISAFVNAESLNMSSSVDSFSAAGDCVAQTGHEDHTD